MKNPQRLKGDGDPFVEKILGSWHDEGPTQTAREDAWSGLASQLGAVTTAAGVGAAGHAGEGVAAGAAGKASVVSEAATSAAATGTTAGLVSKGATWAATGAIKWLAVAAVASGAVATVWVTRSPSESSVAATPQAVPTAESTRSMSRPSGMSAPVAAPAPAAQVPEALDRPTRGAADELKTRGERAGSPSTAPATWATTTASTSQPLAADDRSIGLQVSLLDGARAALAAGETREALRVLDDYDTRFPSGALSQEARVVRVRVLLVAGDRTQAQAVGKRFVLEHASSPYATQMKQILGDAIE